MKEILGETLAGGYVVPFVSEEDRVRAALLSRLHRLKGEGCGAAKRRGRGEQC